MTVFDTAAASLFADPHLAQDGTYTPAGGAAVTLRVILNQPDRDIDVGISGLHVPTLQASVPASALPSGAAAGDTLTVGGTNYRVRQITRDARQVVARLDLDPA